MEEVQVARVTSKGQMTIPRSVREETGIRPGDLVVVRAVDGMVVIAKAEVHSPLLGERMLTSLGRALDRRLQERGVQEEEDLDEEVRRVQDQAFKDRYGDRE